MENRVSNGSVATQFKKGQTGNPLGLSKAQAQRIRRNAEQASIAQESFIDAINSQIASVKVNYEDKPDLIPVKILEVLTPSTNAVMKDAIDRGLGKAVQEIRAKILKTDDPSKLSDEELLEKLMEDDDSEE